MTATAQTINGVPADQWGTWCQHGKRLVEPDPEAAELAPGYPKGRVVDPWPCDADGCTREAFERDLAAEDAEFHADRFAEYLRTI